MYWVEVVVNHFQGLVLKTGLIWSMNFRKGLWQVDWASQWYMVLMLFMGTIMSITQPYSPIMLGLELPGKLTSLTTYHAVYGWHLTSKFSYETWHLANCMALVSSHMNHPRFALLYKTSSYMCRCCLVTIMTHKWWNWFDFAVDCCYIYSAINCVGRKLLFLINCPVNSIGPELKWDDLNAIFSS